MGYNLAMEVQGLSSVALTRMLKAWSGGDRSALDSLTPVVYAELHRLAQYNMAGEREGHLLQPSALVNEAFVRLMRGAPVEWASRAHFFAVSARLMRQILIDFARAQNTGKRGNRAPHVDISEIKDAPGKAANPVDLIDLDAALEDLSGLDPRQAQVVELRYFGGLSVEETAEALGIAMRTVKLDWAMAKSWMKSQLAMGGRP